MSRKTKYFLSISFFAVGAFLAVAFLTARPGDWPFRAAGAWPDVANLSGPLGSAAAYLLFVWVGSLFAWLLPVALGAFGMGIMAGRVAPVARWTAKTAAIVLLLDGFFATLPLTRASSLVGGAAGRAISGVLTAVAGDIGASILLITVLLLVLLRELRVLGRAGAGLLATAGRLRLPRWGIGTALASVARRVRDLLLGGDPAGESVGAEAQEAVQERETPPRVRARGEAREPIKVPEDVPWAEPSVSNAGARSRGARDPAPADRPATRPAAKPARPASGRVMPDETEGVPVISHGPDEVLKSGVPLAEAELPDMEMLQSAGAAFEAFFTNEQLGSWSSVLEDKLANYGIEGKVVAVNQGPVVTTFEFEPAPGVKIKDIVSRSDDLALAMRARSLRLIAPIPGRAVVGIEIPNPDQRSVYLRDILEEIPERLRLAGLMIALGVDANGKPFTFNLCSAPHLLMAGTTGSGKSVSLNCFLASLLFQYRPSDVRMILIDPKMVEMSVYNGIPHLLHPVITDPREAVHAFNYLIGEMERRNELFRNNGVKNIESFNSKFAMGKVDPDYGDEKLPYIVLVVDELGDLVLKKGADIESLLSRLANMARAVGIHMILATQRPSVDVIVGKTKANFPTRIAFRVASKVDSRTILDTMGAEKLLGKGDMLYVDAKHPEALRLHGAWFSEEELEALVAHWKQYEFDDARLSFFEESVGGGIADERDPLFEEAKQVVVMAGQGSTSLLQRRLNVGYARAARILDQLEVAGAVGPPNGSKPREVFITDEEIERTLDR